MKRWIAPSRSNRSCDRSDSRSPDEPSGRIAIRASRIGGFGSTRRLPVFEDACPPPAVWQMGTRNRKRRAGRRCMNEWSEKTWQGYRRPDGRKGVRNLVLVIYTIECASHVAHAIAQGEDDVHVVGFPGCYDNQYAV